jgi:hypothetical protein
MTAQHARKLQTHCESGRGHLICDEAHYLKTPDTKRTLAVLGLDGSRAIATDASRVSFLTGTPLPNNASEMFPMVKTAGLYDGSHWDFLHEFCHIRNTMHGEKITGYKKPGWAPRPAIRLHAPSHEPC